MSRIADPEAALAHEIEQTASYRAAYEAALARVGSLQDALDQAIRERDSARERIRRLELHAGLHVTGGSDL